MPPAQNTQLVFARCAVAGAFGMTQYFEKLRRQAGIIDNQRTRQLRIALSGASSALPYAVYLLVQSGVGSPPGAILLSPPPGTLSDHRLAHHWLFHRAGVPPDCELSDALCRLADHLVPDIRVLVLPQGTGVADVTLLFSPGDLPALPGHRIGVDIGTAGLRVGYGVVPSPTGGPPAALTPTLAAAAAAIAVHQAFTLAGALRPVMLEEFWLSLSALPSRRSDGADDLPEPGDLAVTLNGQRLRAVRTRDALATDADNVLRFALSLHDPRVQDVFALLEMSLWPSAFDRLVPEQVVLDLAGGDAPAIPPQLPAARIFCGGIGGLGSWVAMLLAESLAGGQLTLLDGDREIAPHNLNRQVLYRQAEPQCPKATAAELALRAYRPGHISVCGIAEQLSETPSQPLPPGIAAALDTVDLVVAAFDSFAAKASLGSHASQRATRFVSGGAERLTGDAQLVLPGEGCLLCRWSDLSPVDTVWHMQRDHTRHSCTRELTPADQARLDSAPGPTIALAGALQALLAGLALLQRAHTDPLRVPRLVSFDLGQGTLVCSRRDHTVAPHIEQVREGHCAALRSCSCSG